MYYFASGDLSRPDSILTLFWRTNEERDGVSEFKIAKFNATSVWRSAPAGPRSQNTDGRAGGRAHSRPHNLWPREARPNVFRLRMNSETTGKLRCIARSNLAIGSCTIESRDLVMVAHASLSLSLQLQWKTSEYIWVISSLLSSQ